MAKTTIQFADLARAYLAKMQGDSPDPVLLYWQERYWYWNAGVYSPVSERRMTSSILLWLQESLGDSNPTHAENVNANLRAIVWAPDNLKLNSWLRSPE